MSFKKLVIDISKYQGMIDFKKMKESGKVFGVIIRCGYRGYLNGKIVADPYFFQNVQGCIDNNIPYGVYFFSQAVTNAEAIQEAEYCLKLVKQQSVQPLFPIYIDTEFSTSKKTGRADKLTKANRTDIVKNFCERIEQDKYFAGVYGSTSWFKDQLNDNELLNYSHWVAHYGEKCGYSKLHHIWQYSSGGSVPGVIARTDMNWCYIDFPKVIKEGKLNGYTSEKVPKFTVETNRAVSEHAYDKFRSLANTLKIDLEVTEEKRYYIKTEPITTGDVKEFQNLAKGLIEEVTTKEV